MNLIPLIRRNLFVDLEYNIYNKELGLIRNVNEIIEDNLIDLNKVGISSMSKISLNKFVRKYILGLVRTSNVECLIDSSTPGNSVVNNVVLKKALEYRIELLNNQTKFEKEFWETVTNKEFSKRFHKMSISPITANKRKQFEIIPQPILPVDNRFYIGDFAIRLSGRPTIIVELDGNHHYTDIDTICYDNERTYNLLSKYGLKVVRFKNNEIDYNKLIDILLNTYFNYVSSNMISTMIDKSELYSVYEKHKDKYPALIVLLDIDNKLFIQMRNSYNPVRNRTLEKISDKHANLTHSYLYHV